MKDESEASKYLVYFRLPPSSFILALMGQASDLPATHAAVATVAPFPAWRSSQGKRCAEPEV